MRRLRSLAADAAAERPALGEEQKRRGDEEDGGERDREVRRANQRLRVPGVPPGETRVAPDVPSSAGGFPGSGGFVGAFGRPRVRHRAVRVGLRAVVRIGL